SPSASPTTLPTARSRTSMAWHPRRSGASSQVANAEAFGTLGDRMDKIGPKHKMCRRVGEPLCGRPNCPSNKRPYPPGQHGRGRKRISEYQTRLVEKQKLRAIYGVSEAQMRRYYTKAQSSMDVTGEELIHQLETRLHTVLARLRVALPTRP